MLERSTAVPRFAIAIAVIAVLAAAGRAPNHVHAGVQSVRLAVMEFYNTSSEDGLDALGKGLQSMITSDLAEVKSITLIERARLKDILGEIKLGQSRHFDKKTAARIGKLLGASHLLAGTFTVYGASMRIDARMFSVDSGEIMLAREITGEKDAFFELEKALIKKLIAALGVKLAPKERAGIARIHTADFEAFRRFSQGVDHFDAERYEQAVAALRQASSIDEDFRLARVTLDEYEKLIIKIRGRADQLELARARLRQAKNDAEAQASAQVVEQLFAVADSRDGKNLTRRLAALSYLVPFYSINARNNGIYSRFQDRSDRFVVRRTAEAIVRRYLAESVDRFPDVLLFPSATRRLFKPDKVERHIDDLSQLIAGQSRRGRKNRHSELEKNLVNVESAVRNLAIDVREELRLWELAAGAMREIKGDSHKRRKMLRKIAGLHYKLGDIDASAAALARLSALSDSPRELNEVAKRVEAHRKVATWLAGVRNKAAATEYVLIGGNPIPRAEKRLFDQRRPSVALMRRLVRVRKVKDWMLYHENPVIIDKEPAFIIAGERWLLTGPRLGPRRTSQLRYYRGQTTDRFDKRRPAPDAIVAIGNQPRRDFKARIGFDFRVADDFWPWGAPWEAKTRADLNLDPRRPTVGFVFGMQNIDRENHRLRALAIRFGDRSVDLVQLEASEPHYHRRSALKVRVLASKAIALGRKSRLQAEIRIRRGKARVDVHSAGSVQFSLPKDYQGFPGFHVRGHGYAAIDKSVLR
ncbi:MAG: CsgG/HfaB family protein [Proteobacteria bacterium]|nr:CsgG/HfaB family protein [Pseudomonadota bacterium]